MSGTLLLAVCAGAALLAGMIWGVHRLLSRLIDRRIAAFQAGLMDRHVQEVEHIYRQMRAWRHDYHNHIQSLKAYRALGRMDELDAYLDALESDLNQVDTLLKSGNVMLDAILGSKLSLARSRGIAIHAKAAVPGRLTVSDVDLCVILGNLLDNAMEACARMARQEEAFIRVYIGARQGQLYISVTNTAPGRARLTGGRYRSAKGPSHGFGLMRVDRLVAKYAGRLRRASEADAFTTEILLPL